MKRVKCFWNSKVGTTPQAIKEVFGGRPWSRIALENGDEFALDKSVVDAAGRLARQMAIRQPLFRVDIPFAFIARAGGSQQTFPPNPAALAGRGFQMRMAAGKTLQSSPATDLDEEEARQ